MRHLLAIEPASVRRLLLIEGDDYTRFFFEINARFFNVDELKYLQLHASPADSAHALFCLLSSSRIVSQLKTLRLPNRLPVPLFAPPLFSERFVFHLLANLKTLHFVFPRERQQAQDVMQSLLGLAHLQELRLLVAMALKADLSNLRDYTAQCVQDLAALVSRLDVFKAEGLLVGGRLFTLLKGCTASHWHLSTRADPRVLSDLIMCNPGVRDMSIYTRNSCGPELSEAIKRSKQTTFSLRVVGSIASPPRTAPMHQHRWPGSR
jgi:hypothetical protein